MPKYYSSLKNWLKRLSRLKAKRLEKICFKKHSSQLTTSLASHIKQTRKK